jgi:hypothetical protein
MEMREIPDRELTAADLPLPGANWSEISKFALTFDGYAYWGSGERCAEIANAMRPRTTTEARTCLFYEQRRSHFGCGPDEETMVYIRGLVEQIRGHVTARQNASSASTVCFSNERNSEPRGGVMTLQYHRGKPVRLSEVSRDERWLQDRIEEDPTILGLGDVSVVHRERQQSSGGRIDFLLSDLESKTMYEVEVMLGRLDESHIIRTIEYWDIERRRWPTYDHRAVIVAEEITNRFFNVISLFSHAIPVIAIQLNAMQVESHLVLGFTKVLDIYEEPEVDVPDAPAVDREYWVKRANQNSLAVLDYCVSLLSGDKGAPRITYNKFHIALYGARQGFAWFLPRKAQAHCHFHVKTGEDDAPSAVARLEEAGISTGQLKKNEIKIVVSLQELKDNEMLIRDILESACTKIGGGLR